MANLLTITKEPNDYFTFVLNGDSVNAIKNTRNDLTMVGIFAHFKTSNGANLIKEQNVEFGNITIIDGVTSLTPTSPDDLFAKLISVNFFDWINGTGGGGVNRFDDLLDTFDYFGQEGKIPVVNEAQLRLDPLAMPDVTYLSKFPSPLVPLKFLKVKADNTGYEFVDLPISENVGIEDFNPLIASQQDFIIPDNTEAFLAFVNGTPYFLETANNSTQFNTFTQVANTVTFKTALEINEYPIIFYQ